jgi:hypothetical protein
MTTTEDYLELTSLKDKIDSILVKTEDVITSQIIKFDFFSGYKNGLTMIHAAADKKVFDDKKPETLVKLAASVKTRIELFKENINNAVCYPLQTEQSREHARGQIAGICAASRILFKYNVLKEIGEDIAYFKVDRMVPTQEQPQSQMHSKSR